MNVLSLFDGMSCWMIALERAGIKVDKYYASEIDKYAIQVSKDNYPQIQHIWDVQDVNYDCSDWNFWYVDYYWKDRIRFQCDNIDLLIWWSPCQWFSFAGKQLNFEDPRSKLFFEYVRILKQVKPKYFMLENVRMKKEYQDVISEHLFWVQPIEINSALVSAQNRNRLYWVWKLNNEGWYDTVEISQPGDKGIILKDVLQGLDEIAFTKTHWTYKARKEKSTCIDSNYSKGIDNHGQRTVVGVAQRGRYNEEGKTEQKIEPRKDSKANCITSVSKDSMVMLGMAEDINGHDFLKRIYSEKWKAPTLTAVCGGNQERKVAIDDMYYRKLTPIECERLQTLPDNYSEGVSNTQRYKMLWNGWTIDVITHIFKHLK